MRGVMRRQTGGASVAMEPVVNGALGDRLPTVAQEERPRGDGGALRQVSSQRGAGIVAEVDDAPAPIFATERNGQFVLLQAQILERGSDQLADAQAAAQEQQEQGPIAWRSDRL